MAKTSTKKANSTPQSADTADPSDISTGELDTLGPIFQDALNLEVKIADKAEKTITKSQMDSIVMDVANEYRTDQPTALVGIFSTLQAGGTNKNKRSNIKITIADIPFQSKDINKIISKHCKDFTPRQFAVHYRTSIFQMAKKHNITGSCYVSLKRNYSHMLTGEVPDEKFWATDFQLDNPACPEYIRAALNQRFVDKFTRPRN
jgi:hypothetical protein